MPMDNGGSPRDALGKLLPKTLTEKRRRRKEKKAGANDSNSSLGVDDDERVRGRSLSPAVSGRGSSSFVGSEDGDDASSSKRSLASLDSQKKKRQQQQQSTQEKIPLQEEENRVVGQDEGQQSYSASRPATISAHPSLIGYLTTSSPVVQAEHLDSQHDDPESLSAALSASTSNDDIPPAPPLEPPVLAPPAAAKIASPSRRGKPAIEVEVETRPPRTPPTNETPSHAPAIVNTPPTPVETQSARAFASDWKAPWRGSSPPRSADGSSPSRNMSAHRRSRSGSVNHGPSKLSTITSAPLSPPIEGVESTASGPSNASGGFFSSMFSAAQNAANNISTNIQNSGINIGPNKNKPNTPAKSLNSATSSRTSITPLDTTPKAEPPMEKKESSLRSIGSGDLSLSHLGLPDLASGEASPASTKFPELSDQRARSESAPVDSSQAASIDLSGEGSSSRPRSLIEPVAGSNDELPSYDQADGKLGLLRNSSLRSASKTHRKRGSSVATAGTGTTIGAAIAAANSSLANPSATPGAPKLTGFAIASKKRNRDFHSIFKSVPDDDYLIEDYSCALQREILAHGRLYVSEGHLCFSSNILGWTTTLVMSFDEIVSVEKRSTALVFKNGLMISTLHAKHIFASFTSRDATYDLIVNIWKLGHPTLTSTLNGVRLEGTGGDKTERPDNDPSNAGNESQLDSDSAEDSGEDDSEYYDSDDNDDVSENPELAESAITTAEPEKSVARKASAALPTGSTPAPPGKESPVLSSGEADFPGPATHAPTDCGDKESHYDKIVGDEIIQAPLGKVYNLLFGPPSSTFMGKWLTVEQKCTELQMDDKKGLVPGNTSRTYSYIKPLGGSIGPKQTKCIVTETLENLDLEKVASFNVSTQTPDVPSGNVFVTKTHYCLSWAENNATRLQMNCTVEWSGKSWLKGPIEKGANDGQALFCKDICAALRAAVSSKPKAGTMSATPGKTKRKGKRGKTTQPSGDAAEGRAPQNRAAKQDWGALEPLRQILEPLVDILQPVFTGNVMYGLLVGLLVATWFGFGFTPNRDASHLSRHPQMGAYFPDRLAAYEEMWRREDSELWEWLEERVGVGRLGNAETKGSSAASSSASAAGYATKKKRVVDPRTLEEKIREERMDGRQVEEAIRVTEEKLNVLRQAMQRVNLANGDMASMQEPGSKEEL
ncbi:hypothetical protein NLU13_4772 [Sarocladium strictum]|uniref:VASt domain-containing protein n=1 Tax=Sarocladium strictum TaxID=5046 RepID=A0AA39GKA8_SARSR|nr:hypothetical protein NLU13_4772 [Sarocladium strictum]